MSDKENIVKETARELGMTYKELAEAIGYGESAIKTAVSTGKVSKPMIRAIELYLENIDLKQKLKTSENFKQLLKDFLNN